MRQSENLPEAQIQKFTGFHNLEYKKNIYILFIWEQFCLYATLWGCRKKNVEVQEETAYRYSLQN